MAAATPARAKDAKFDSLTEAVLEVIEDLHLKIITVRIQDAQGGRHESETPKVNGPTVTQKVSGTLAPGKYTVIYRVISADGHPVDGEVPSPSPARHPPWRRATRPRPPQRPPTRRLPVRTPAAR